MADHRVDVNVGLHQHHRRVGRCLVNLTYPAENSEPTTTARILRHPVNTHWNVGVETMSRVCVLNELSRQLVVWLAGWSRLHNIMAHSIETVVAID